MTNRQSDFIVYFLRGSLTFGIYFYLFDSFLWSLFGTFLLSLMYWIDDGAVVI